MDSCTGRRDKTKTLLKTLLNTLQNNQSKLKDHFNDDNLMFDEYGRKFFNREENTAGKGEIARYEQFFLFLQCFQKTCTANTSKPGLLLDRVNSLPNDKL